jgi:hypothetical protein
MTDVIVVPQAAHWQRLKRLVLDSVSSPITRRVYNLGLDEFFDWYGREPRPGFTKATVAAWRVALEARGLGAVSINVRITAVKLLHAQREKYCPLVASIETQLLSLRLEVAAVAAQQRETTVAKAERVAFARFSNFFTGFRSPKGGAPAKLFQVSTRRLIGHSAFLLGWEAPWRPPVSFVNG